MTKILFALMRNPYFWFAALSLLVASHTYTYIKGIQHTEAKYLKKDIGKGVENAEILSNRPDDIISILHGGQF